MTDPMTDPQTIVEGMTMKEDVRVPLAPGSREPSPAVSAASGFDPSREARCQSCLKLAPSSQSIAFFEDRGEGSRAATQLCKVCKCYEVAHHPRGDDAPVADRGKIPSIIGEPHQFEPHGPWEFDAFYCGCRGWE